MNGYSRSAAVLGVSMAVLTLGACDSGTEEERIRTPDFQLTDLEGNTFRLSQQKGKVVILNFFLTTCGTCREETPDFVAFEQEYESRGVVVVGISGETEETLRQYVQAFGVGYPVLHDPGQKVSNTPRWRGYGVNGTPTTVIVNKEGYIDSVFDDTGLSQEDLEQLAEPLL